MGNTLSRSILSLRFVSKKRPNFQGPNFRFSNTGYSRLLYKPENENWILMGHNFTEHLLQSGLDQ